MGNPNWKKGGPSPNGHGRPKKKSAEPVARMIERFIRKNITPNKMQKLYDGLDAGGKLSVLTDLLPYCISKKPVQADISVGHLSDQQVDDLFSRMMDSVTLEPGQTTLMNLPANPAMFEPAETVNNDRER